MNNPRIQLPLPYSASTSAMLRAAIALHERLNFQHPTCLRIHPIQYANLLGEMRTLAYTHYPLGVEQPQAALQFCGVTVLEDHRVNEGTVQVGYTVEFE